MTTTRTHLASHGADDIKRRAADALLAALEEGFKLTDILELAADDATTSEYAHERAAALLDIVEGF